MAESDEVISAMLDLARDRRFVALRARAKRAPLGRAEFDLLPKPDGYPPDKVWDLLNALRRQTAVTTPCPDARGRVGWYSVTNSIMEDCGVIDRRCCEGSRLATAIAGHDALNLMLEQVVREARCVLVSDGVRLGYEETRAVVAGAAQPVTAEQRIVSNAVAILYETPRLARGEVDEALVMGLRTRLGWRVGADVRMEPPRPGELARRFVRIWTASGLTRDEAVSTVLSIANGWSVDPAEHPLLRCLAIDDVLTHSPVLPSLRATVSWLLARILVTRAGLPALAFMPVHDVVRQWAHGELRPRVVDMGQDESAVMVGDTVDFTGNVAGTVELVREAVEEVDERIADVVAREDLVDERLGRRFRLNHRQRCVLRQALSDPNAHFRIATHQRAYGVAYATARADLLGLERLGILARVESGRAFDFVPRRDIGPLLGGA